MNYGLSIPNYGEYGDPRVLAALAHEAEEAGWDGFFIWDHINLPNPQPMSDPWVALTAIALSTHRIRLGPMVTPIPRRRPWVLARQTLSLDQISNGRLILGVGLGYFTDEEFAALGEETDAKIRAGKLDEGLEVLTGLWSNQPFSFAGEHFQINNVHMYPAPVQQRIPIWVAGIWPNKAPMRRAARWDGVFPIGGADGNPLPSADIQSVVAYVREHRADATPFEVVYGHWTSGEDRAQDAARVAPYREAGVTWWLESPEGHSLAEVRERIRKGPPRD